MPPIGKAPIDLILVRDNGKELNRFVARVPASNGDEFPGAPHPGDSVGPIRATIPPPNSVIHLRAPWIPLLVEILDGHVPPVTPTAARITSALKRPPTIVGAIAELAQPIRQHAHNVGDAIERFATRHSQPSVGRRRDKRGSE